MIDVIQNSNVPQLFSPVQLNPDASQGHLHTILCKVIAGQVDAIPWPSIPLEGWDHLLQIALNEGVGPYFHWVLKEKGELHHLPSGIQTRLVREHFRVVANNALIFQELERVLDVFETAGIQTVLLKGADLSSVVYPDPGLRPMGDLDLLVREDQLFEAMTLVKDLGYQLEEMLRGLPEKLRRRIHYEANYRGGVKIPIHLELHWNLIGGRDSCYRPDVNWFWEETSLWIGPGKGRQYQQVFVLSPTARLLYLIAHLMLKHAGRDECLRWYLDLHLLIQDQGEEIDWDVLIHKAKEFQWEKALYPALTTLQKWFETPLPDHLITGRITGSELEDFRKAHQRKGTSLWRESLVELGELKWLTRLQLMFLLIFPTPTYLRWRYNPHPAWSWPLYYPYRWWVIFTQLVRPAAAD